MALNGDLALSLIVEETAERLRRLASSYSRSYPRKAGLLRLASTLLDLLASELAAGRPSSATLERLESMERLLRWSGLPWQQVARLRKLASRRLQRMVLAGLELEATPRPPAGLYGGGRIGIPEGLVGP